MKTAEKLFDKYECLIPEEEMNSANMDFGIEDRRTDVIQYDDFLNALKEHDVEIVEMIDDMIKTDEGKSDIGDMLFIERRAVLTELKNKLLMCEK